MASRYVVLTGVECSPFEHLTRFASIDYFGYRVRNRMHSIDDVPTSCLLGTYRWYKYGRLHRDNDKPTMIDPHSQRREWHSHGTLHRHKNKPVQLYAGTGTMLCRKFWLDIRDDDKPSGLLVQVNSSMVIIVWHKNHRWIKMYADGRLATRTS